MSYTIKEKFDIIDKQINDVGKRSLNYVFLADPHVDEYLKKDENKELRIYEAEEIVELRLTRLVKHLEEAVKFAENNENIDFLAVGGDVLNAYSIKGKQSVIDTYNRSLAPLLSCKKPVLMAFGNHDDNAFQTLNPDVPEIKKEWVISDKDWKEKVLALYPFAKKCVFDKNYEYSKYFYFDIENKKTRVIVLDTMDMRRPFDENGTVTEIVNRLPRFWYTYEQLDWLCNQALTAGNGWNYTFISHMGIDYDTSCNCKNGEMLRDIFKAFNKREKYSYNYTDMNGNEVTVNADFTGIKDSKLLLFNFGHQHSELVHYSEDINLWQVATGCENAWGGWGGPAGIKDLPWVLMKDRTEGTENETCMDVFSLNERVGYKYNVGPGMDAVMKY
ncbi:MAG: hypothetical protein E7562_04265 [Ruminococcaceae bacterium]|nr:hypothetical protein [Oscillospiraceae bacterium]